MREKRLKTIAIIAIILAICAVAAFIFYMVFDRGGTAAPEANEPVISATPDEPKDVVKPDDPDRLPASDLPPGGDIVYDYNDLATAIADIPKKEALNEIYILLEGYWDSGEGPFVRFFFDTKGNHGVGYGLAQTGFGADGILIDGHATGKYEAVLDVLFPAVAATEMDDGTPESIQEIHVDLADLHQNATIRVKTDRLGNGGWYVYEPGGPS